MQGSGKKQTTIFAFLPLPRGFSRSAGFTLLEILAVVFVVALIASIVVVNISRDENKLALLEAKKFSALANHLQDESILQGYSFGISADSTGEGYQFWRLKDQWQPLSDELFRPRSVVEVVKFNLIALNTEKSINDQDSLNYSDSEQAVTNAPQIILEPEGLVNLFEARFKGNSATYVVKSDENQKITFVRSKAK